jgi:hypothetical protein
MHCLDLLGFVTEPTVKRRLLFASMWRARNQDDASGLTGDSVPTLVYDGEFHPLPQTAGFA